LANIYEERSKMIFNLGKNKGETDRPMESEIIDRWRRASLATKGKGEHTEQADPSTISLRENQILERETQEIPAWGDYGGNVSAPASTETASSPRRVRIPSSDSSLSADDDLRRRFGTNVRSALGPGTVINGKLSFDAPVRIDGVLKGEVTSTSTLIVGEQAVVDADIRVGSLIVLGHVEGPVHAEDLVEIKRGGAIEGDVKTQRLVIEEGGLFEGACNV